jgi:hypothetical protein
MHDVINYNGYIASMMGAYIDSNLSVHFDVTDNSGHHWSGFAAPLVFAWKNNMGTVTTQTLGGAKWIQIPLSDGTIFGAGCALNMPDGSTLQLPSAAGDGSTLQLIAGSRNGMPISGSDHAQGVGACYLDADNIVHVYFQNGAGMRWSGSADVFAIYCTPASSAPVQVRVTPSTANIAAGTTKLFSAAVSGSANPNVIWAVDGIVGGNVTVGTINASGLYAPSLSGSHTITATSIAAPTASGSATVTVYGSPSSLLPPGEAILTDDNGNFIYLNGEMIYVEE